MSTVDFIPRLTTQWAQGPLSPHMNRPKPTYCIKARRELTKQERLVTRLRKPRCPVKGLPHGGPSRVSSLLVGHPTAYEKFVINKYIKAENTLERYFH